MRGGFLGQWNRALHSNTLAWFAEKDAKSDPIRSLNLEYAQDLVGNKDLTVWTPGIPNEYVSRIIPILIGVNHCAFPPLHGELEIESIDKSFINHETVQAILTAFGISNPLLQEKKGILLQQIAELSQLPAHALELVAPGIQNDILGLLKIPETHNSLIYIDPEVGKVVNAFVIALIRSNSIFTDPWRFRPRTNYQKKLQESGLNMYYPSEGNIFFGIRYMWQNVMKEIGGDKKHKMTMADFRRALCDYFDRTNGEEFLRQLPPLITEVKLDTRDYKYSSGLIITFQEFLNALSIMFPEAVIPTIPDSAERLADIPQDLYHNMIMEFKDGLKIGFYLSHSSGRCPQHR